MKKIFTLLFLIFTLFIKGQGWSIEENPAVWDGVTLRNSISYQIPAREGVSHFLNAGIYFEKATDNGYIVLRYRVFPTFTIESMNIQELPLMMVKLGNGKILTGIKDRITTGVINNQETIDVYFNLDKDLQNQILSYGIEKVRFAYNTFNEYNIETSIIVDFYTADSEIKELTIGDLLKQVQEGSVAAEKQKASKLKKSLDADF